MRQFLLIFLLAGMLLPPTIHAKSLFDEEKKDAASALKLDIEEDRELGTEENLQYIEMPRTYFSNKIKALEEKMDLILERLGEIEEQIGIEQ